MANTNSFGIRLISLALLVVLGVAQGSAEESFKSSPTDNCTVDDIRLDFTECDPDTNTMKAFFYYSPDKWCNL